MNHFVFDLDGVLIDSRKAVNEAYYSAGVFGSDNYWGRPAKEWCDPVSHGIKVALYPDKLRHYGRLLPMGAILQDLRKAAYCGVLTSASHDALKAVHSVWPDLLVGVSVLGTGCSFDDKVNAMREFVRWMPEGKRPTYFDDNLVYLKQMKLRGELEQWNLVHVSSL